MGTIITIILLNLKNSLYILGQGLKFYNLPTWSHIFNIFIIPKTLKKKSHVQIKYLDQIKKKKKDFKI